MKITSLLLLLFLWDKLIFGQIQLGTGTTAVGLPMSFSYRYNLSQTIYLKSDISTAGLISSISYYAMTRSYADDIKIYMAETDKTEFSGSSDWLPLSGFTLVYEGKFPELTAPGWCNVAFQNKFAYSNTKSLAVLFYEFEPGYHSGYSFWGSAQRFPSLP